MKKRFSDYRQFTSARPALIFGKPAFLFVLFLGLAGMTFCVSGCNPSGLSLGKVSGQVTLDGKPVTDVKITFQPDSNERPATGYVDAKGNYQLQTVKKGDGAIIGTHKIAVNSTTPPPMSGARNEESSTSLKNAVPPRYGNFKSSGLTFEVKKGKNVYNIELHSK